MGGVDILTGLHDIDGRFEGDDVALRPQGSGMPGSDYANRLQTNVHFPSRLEVVGSLNKHLYPL